MTIATISGCTKKQELDSIMLDAFLRFELGGKELDENQRFQGCPGELGPDARSILKKKLWYEAMDLNLDGVPEIQIFGDLVGCYCGNGDDSCRSWIFRRVGNSYEHIGGSGKPIKTQHNGYLDLVDVSSGWPEKGVKIIYWFNGVRYVDETCITADSSGTLITQTCEKMQADLDNEFESIVQKMKRANSPSR